MSMEYEEAIAKLKENHPDLADIRFDISDGELGYVVPFDRPALDIHALQKEINEMLGQKTYVVKFIGYKQVEARSVEEAREFLSRTSPPVVTTVVSINEFSHTTIK